ncbi:MAG TPA: class I SAM-dependent methyltransferase [bacterium]|nr:class I SAM-dependent methyltransferase [bacterium]
MSEYQGTTGSGGSWEETYQLTSPGDLPWNAGQADGDLKDLLGGLSLDHGKAYDLGCGPGNDAAYLAQKGWRVTAVDISPSAVKLARETAVQTGVEGKIQFVTADVLSLKGAGDAALVVDRGCFHTLPSETWGDYVGMISGLLKRGGILALKVFSFKEPGGIGPCRFTADELESVFGNAFELTSVKETIFQGPRKPYALFGVFRKK